MEIAQQLMLAEREITWGSGKSGWKQYHLFPRCDGEYGELASESSGEADEYTLTAPINKPKYLSARQVWSGGVGGLGWTGGFCRLD